MDPLSVLLIIGAIIAAVIFGPDLLKKLSEPTMQTAQPITAAELDEYMKKLTSVAQGTSVVKALSTGTGDRTILMQLFPKPEFEGWDEEGKAQDPVNPNNADGSINWIYMEDYTFFADIVADSGFIVTDSNGAKHIPLAENKNGIRKYNFQSFKVTPGTMMMIKAWMSGSLPATGFMLQGRSCRNIEKLLIDYPELTGGNNGIMWDRNWDCRWTITTLNKDFFHVEMRKKFNTCLQTAASISPWEEGEPEEAKKGLHYADGTEIINTKVPTNKAYGRWIYDYKCDPIIDPKTNKQAYDGVNQSGWGMNCKDAYNFCALTPGLLVGVKLSQFDITDEGIPTFTGVEDVTGGIAMPANQLNPDQIGWVMDTTKPPPADALDQLNALKPATPGEDAPPAQSFRAAPASQISRFATASHEMHGSAPDSDSVTNTMPRVWISGFEASRRNNPTATRHATHSS